MMRHDSTPAIQNLMHVALTATVKSSQKLLQTIKIFSLKRTKKKTIEKLSENSCYSFLNKKISLILREFDIFHKRHSPPTFYQM